MTNQLTKTMPTLRAEKTGNRNKDDFRVLVAGVVFCILLIFGQNAYARFYDAFLAPRPFVTADTLEIVYVEQEVEPLILYDADPNQNVSGTWIASVYLENDTRLASRRGQGDYIVQEDEAKFWSWSAFFDNEQSDPPAIPDQPFYVCVRYVVEANDSGVDDSTERFCSNIVDPNDPNPKLTQFLDEEITR